MEVVFDVSAIPVTDEQIKTFLLPREPREEIQIEKVELTPEMIAEKPPLPDPVFLPDDFCPCTYDVGAPLNRLDAHDADFKEMIQQMFEAGPELRLTKEGIEDKVEEYQEVTMPMVENE
jgi:hypothetical protein